MPTRTPVDTAIERLLPVQPWVYVDDSESDCFDEAKMEPVAIVPYDTESSENLMYLIVDGHNRAYRAHLIGKVTVACDILASDRDVRESTIPSMLGYASIDEVKDSYNRSWRHHAASTVPELVQAPPLHE